MSSPHGSKLREFVRFIANVCLSDGQRKKIKGFVRALQSLPIKLFGINTIIHSQRSEIERLKSRLNILDGKLNIALYGMPGVEEEYRSSTMVKGLLCLNPLPLRVNQVVSEFDSFRKWLLPENYSTSVTNLQNVNNSLPKQGLIVGLGFGGIADNWNPWLKHTDKLYLNDTNVQFIQEAEKAFQIRFPNQHQERLCTDSITALLALSDVQFDWIGDFFRFQRLPPSEQLYFLHLAQERLNPGGGLLMTLPNLNNPKVRDDLYWADSKNLRPYSITMIKDVLGSYLGTVVETVDDSALTVTILYRKALSVADE